MCYILYSGFHCITKKIKNISVKQVPIMCSQLIGVHLVGEVDLNRTNTRSDVVGVIRLLKADASLVEVRGLISSELAAFHHDFVFLTQEKIPVWKHQERNITASDVLGGTTALFITRNFDKWRIGVKKSVGPVIGFIFADRNILLTQFRSEINEQASFGISDLLDGEFSFCDRNGWPVKQEQEKDLAGWDVISQGVVTIQLPHIKPPLPCNIKGSKDCRKRKKNRTARVVSFNSCKKAIRRAYRKASKKLQCRQQLRNGGNGTFSRSSHRVPCIGWCQSKKESVVIGYIYIAVKSSKFNCGFYARVYVKLADYIGKFVIPVNFLRTWPPNHLAIQFASIQYIDWRKPNEVQQGSRESDGEEEESLRVWEKRSVDRVASDIYSSLRQCREEFPYPHSFSEKSVIAPADSGTPMICPDGRPFVIISAHPQDKDFCARLQSLLERNCYEAWCSLDVLTSSSQNAGASSPSSSSTTPTTPMAGVPVFSSQESQGPLDACFSQPARPPPLLRVPSFQFSSSMDTALTNVPFVLGFSFGTVAAADANSDSMSAKDSNRKNEFRRQAQRAELVLLVLSETYMQSRASQQQAYYCLLRKKVVVVSCTDKEVPVSLQKRLQFASLVVK
ncbi:unnamed protein product, partial [Ixodes pacificus]